MTEYNNNDLKSSVYNQKGENYFQRLSAFNSMSSHIRRILLAKSTVDARNKNYISENRDFRIGNLKSQFSKHTSMDDLINRIAYDTENHPLDLLKISSVTRCMCGSGNLKDQEKSFKNSHRTSMNRSTSRTRKSLPIANKLHTFLENAEKAHEKHINSEFHKHNHLYQRYTEKPVNIACKSILGSPSCISNSSSDSSMQEGENPLAPSNLDYETHIETDTSEAKYVAFIYDITRDIMRNGLYTDRDLQDVFKKHLERNRSSLDMNKMLHEIYQLKTFLNISNDSDADNDAIEELTYTKQMLDTDIRPSTPPIVLDENKVLGKLLSYQNLTDKNKKPNGNGKSVVLIDANPELRITERDILTSLVEVGIDPKQAEDVFKSLYHKSKETVFNSTVQIETEVTYPSKLISLEEDISPEQNHVETNSSVLIDKENKETFVEHVQDKETSITSDLMLRENIAQSNMQSLYNDNYTET